GVTPWPQEVTAQMVANFLAGGAVVNAIAAQAGAEVCVVDVGVAAGLPPAPGLLSRKIRPGTADMTAGPAMSADEARRAVEAGIETARDLVAAGNRCLVTGDMGIANTTASAALIAVFTGAEAREVTGRGTGIDDEMWERKVSVIRRALARHRPDPADPLAVLAAGGGLEHGALAGFRLGAAALRTPVVLDGVIACAAALAARALAPDVVDCLVAGHMSTEPGARRALTALGLRPLLDLDMRLGEGSGAALAVPVVQAAAPVLRDVAASARAGGPGARGGEASRGPPRPPGPAAGPEAGSTAPGAETPVYPLSLRLEGRRVLVVGGGSVALRRVAGLRAAGAEVVVVAPRLTPALGDLAARGLITARPRGYQPGDLDGAWLVLACTDQPRVNEALAADAERQHIWCARADDAVASAAWVPAVGRTGAVTVAVNAGRDPRRAAELRDRLVDTVDAEGRLAEKTAEPAADWRRRAGRVS